MLYVTEDGKHLLQGPIYAVDGDTPVNVTNQILKGKLDALQDQMIVYKAAQEKHVITVFTDITCGYCHKLHEQMKDYNDLGITIRYLAFPRQGLNSPTEKDMQSIWCTANRKRRMTPRRAVRLSPRQPARPISVRITSWVSSFVCKARQRSCWRTAPWFRVIRHRKRC